MHEHRLFLLTNLAIAIAVCALLWIADVLLGRVSGVMIDLVVAALVAYLLLPAVRPLARVMPRGVAVLVVYLVVLGALGIAIARGLPVVADQARQLAADFPERAAQAEAQARHAAPGSLEPMLRHLLATYATRAGTFAGAAAGFAGAHAVGLVRGSVKTVVDLVVVLLLAFFFITEVDRIRALAVRLTPSHRRAAFLAFVDESDRVIAGFVRGQLLMAAAVGIAAAVVLVVLGIRYAALLAVLVGMLSVVPLVGPILGAVPAILVALFTAGPVKAGILLAVFVVIFELQSHVLTPVVIGKAVGVSPFVIFLAILIGAEVHGVLGMLLAVPLAGIARVALDRMVPDDATAATHRASPQLTGSGG